MATQNDQEFLEFVTKSIVDNPKDVSIERTIDEMGVLLTLKVHPEDMAQVIGRQGSTARSIRTLLRIVGMKNNARVNLKIEEPEGSTRAPVTPVTPVAPVEEKAPDKVPDVEGAVGDLE